MPVARRPYVAVTITLTSANTNYEILTLVNAVLALATAPSEAPGACRVVNIQAHPGIDGSGGNTNDVLIGDAELATTRIGYVLNPGGSRAYESTSQNALVGGIYARSAGAGQKLNVEICTS